MPKPAVVFSSPSSAAPTPGPPRLPAAVTSAWNVALLTTSTVIAIRPLIEMLLKFTEALLSVVFV